MGNGDDFRIEQVRISSGPIGSQDDGNTSPDFVLNSDTLAAVRQSLSQNFSDAYRRVSSTALIRNDTHLLLE